MGKKLQWFVNFSKKNYIVLIIRKIIFYFAIIFGGSPDLVEAVKKLPNRKWNNDAKIWGVPAQYEKEVLKFAKEHQFFLDFEGNIYANNSHFAEFTRFKKNDWNDTHHIIDTPNIPNGIKFCEGRLANQPDNLFKKEFWWCLGDKCFSKCETIHTTEEWEKYTLLDFCEILGFNTYETNKMGDYIPKGRYYQFIGIINRFNRLLDKLYCHDCGHILYPVETSLFAAYTVVRFHCVNENCSNHDVIYLNHCLNRKCNNIIDSRISKKCPNGLYICDNENCGCCCSHDMFNRRLSNLETTDYPNNDLKSYVYNNIKRCVNERLGHLERGEHFCYKCGGIMEEIDRDVFYCSKCDIKYDTSKNYFKRPHIHLKQTVTASKNGNDNNDILPPFLYEDDNVPF